MEKKLLMPLSDFNDRVSTIMDEMKLQIYIRGVKKHPGIGFMFLDLKDEQFIKTKEDFLNAIRALVEHEIKRYYDIVPDWE
jgi:glutaredoxin-related protein